MRARRALWVMMSLAAALLVAGVQPPALAGTPISTDAAHESYYPLQVGNYWVYARNGPVASEAWKVAVTGRRKAPNGQRYFVLEGYFGEATRLVRRSLQDVVTEFSPDSSADKLWYLLGAPVGTNWNLELAPLMDAGSPGDCIDRSRLTIVSRTERITVPAGTFDRVVHVRFEPPCADAGILDEWFAPGVGLVMRAENSFAGPVVSGLVLAEIGEHELPPRPYSTTLGIDRPVYVNNLMPPVPPDALPTVRGAFVLRNETSVPISFVFSGCKSVSIRVRDAAGNVVLRASGDDGGCCECDNIFRFELVKDVLVIPVTFRLVAPDGRPLPDGRYAVEATLDSLETGSVRASATADIEVRSVY